MLFRYRLCRTIIKPCFLVDSDAFHMKPMFLRLIYDFHNQTTSLSLIPMGRMQKPHKANAFSLVLMLFTMKPMLFVGSYASDYKANVFLFAPMVFVL